MFRLALDVERAIGLQCAIFPQVEAWGMARNTIPMTFSAFMVTPN